MSIQSKADFEGQDGKRVTVVGVYRQHDVRMRQRPPARFVGHALVELGDGVTVLLEPIWSPAAKRGGDEIAAHEGKKVQVTGTFHVHGVDPPEPMATMTGPCISPVESVRSL